MNINIRIGRIICVSITQKHVLQTQSVIKRHFAEKYRIQDKRFGVFTNYKF